MRERWGAGEDPQRGDAVISKIHMTFSKSAHTGDVCFFVYEARDKSVFAKLSCLPKRAFGPNN